SIAVAAGETLELSAMRDLAIEADLIIPESHLTVSAGRQWQSGTITATGDIDVERFTFAENEWVEQRWVQVGENLPAFSANDFQVDIYADFLRVTGGSGTSVDPYRVADIYGLQGIASDSHRDLH